MVIPLLPLSTNILAKKAPKWSYPTLPKGDLLLSPLLCFPHPLSHQLVENWQDWFSQRDW